MRSVCTLKELCDTRVGLETDVISKYLKCDTNGINVIRLLGEFHEATKVKQLATVPDV